MRKIFTLFSLLGIAAMANADTYVTADNLVYDYDPETKTATIYGHWYQNRRERFYQGSSLTVEKTITIGEATYDITLIGSFSGCPNLETLVVPESVELSENSFRNCEKLVSISMAEGLTAIPDGCFSGTAITDLSFLPSTIETIGTIGHHLAYISATGAFSKCGQLETVSLPKSVKNIGAFTFSSCANLRQVDLHEGIVSICKDAFSSCTSLESVSIPSTVTTLGSYVFYRDSSLTSVSLPDGLYFIGKNTFDSTSLTEITLPSDLESIRMGLLSSTPIESLSIPAKVTRVIPRGLSNMRKLKTLTIMDSSEPLDFDLKADRSFGRDPWPDTNTQETDAIGSWLLGTTGIERLYLGRNTATWIHPDFQFFPETRSNEDITNPFYTMESLESITIGPEVTDASQLVFENYANLKEITVMCKIPPVLNPLTSKQASNVKVTVPEGSLDAYRNVTGWSDISNMGETSSAEAVIDAIINTQLYNLQGVRVDDSHSRPVIKVSTYKDGHTKVCKILQ